MLANRPGQPADAPRVLEVLHAAHAWNAANGFNFTASSIAMADLLARLDPGRFLVAEQDGAPVGTLAIRPADEAGVMIFNLLAVAPEAAGTGVGKALVVAAEECAAALGARRMRLDTPENHPRLPAYYARMGYEVVGHVQWPGKRYRSVVMERGLDDCAQRAQANLRP